MHVLIIPSEHFVTPRFPAGGIFQLDQARALQAAGHRVGVINTGVISPRFLLRTYPYLKREAIDGIPVYRRYARRLGLQRRADPGRTIGLHVRLGLPLYQEYKRIHGRPDVIHAHDTFVSASLAARLSQIDRVPYVLTEHSSVFTEGGPRAQVVADTAEAVRGAAARTAVSGYLAGFVERAYGLPSHDVRILPNVVGREFREIRRPLIHRNEFTFLTAASLDENKDQTTLINAFAASFKGQPVVLRIIGSGPLRQHLETLARESGVEEQVTFVGFLSRERVVKEMAVADCFVLTSRRETFGVVLIEALACGLPLVATRCGGPEEIVTNARGRLVAIGDSVALAAAMTGIVASHGSFDASILQHDCLLQFGPEAFARRAADLYQRAMDHSLAQSS